MRKVLLFNDTSRYQHYGCDLVMHSIVTRLRQRGLTPVSVHRVGTSVEKRFDAIMQQHPDAAAIVVNGEGVIHHDRKHALGLAALAGRAQALGVPAHLINAALFENSEALYRDLARYRSVYVRDSESRAAAQAHGIDATLVPDLSFDGIALLGLGDAPRSGVLVTDSVHPESTGKLMALAQRLHAPFVPMRRSVALPFAWMRMAGARRFVRRVRAAESVLTGRFHSVTVCLATRTPFLACGSNTRKIEAILKDALGDERRMLTQPWSEADVLPRLERIAFDAAESASIDTYLARGADATRAMFDRLAQP
jgi:hypothetical protein